MNRGGYTGQKACTFIVTRHIRNKSLAFILRVWRLFSWAFVDRNPTYRPNIWYQLYMAITHLIHHTSPGCDVSITAGDKLTATTDSWIYTQIFMESYMSAAIQGRIIFIAALSNLWHRILSALMCTEGDVTCTRMINSALTWMYKWLQVEEELLHLLHIITAFFGSYHYQIKPFTHNQRTRSYDRDSL